MAIKSGTCFQDSVVPSHGLQNKPYTLIPTNQQAHLKKKPTGKEMENLQSKASKDELKSLATGNTKVFLTVWLRDSEATIALPQLTLF